MLLLKPGVRITGLRPELVLALVAIERAFQEAGYECVVTSGIDSKHSTGSMHYSGSAVDLRTRHVPAQDLPNLVTRIRECLGEDFDVVLETDHLHAEFQPKRPLTA